MLDNKVLLTSFCLFEKQSTVSAWISMSMQLAVSAYPSNSTVYRAQQDHNKGRVRRSISTPHQAMRRWNSGISSSSLLTRMLSMRSYVTWSIRCCDCCSLLCLYAFLLARCCAWWMSLLVKMPCVVSLYRLLLRLDQRGANRAKKYLSLLLGTFSCRKAYASNTDVAEQTRIWLALLWATGL